MVSRSLKALNYIWQNILPFEHLFVERHQYNGYIYIRIEICDISWQRMCIEIVYQKVKIVAFANGTMYICVLYSVHLQGQRHLTLEDMIQCV